MWGQWLGGVQGEAGTRLMINIDEDTPNSGRVHIVTKGDKEFVLGQGRIVLESDQIGARGNVTLELVQPPQTLEGSPPGAIVEIQNAGHVLALRFRSTWGSEGTAVFEKVDDAQPIPPARIYDKWSAFKSWIETLSPAGPWTIFRGQSDGTWTLRTTFHRHGRRDLVRYADDVERLRNVVTGITGRFFNTDNAVEHGSLLHVAQHHGFPTPLLDWTESPYIAAFFAFAELGPEANEGNVRVLAFQAAAWLRDQQNVQSVVAPFPYFNVNTFTPIENPRALPQQSVVTATNLVQPEGYIRQMEAERRVAYLEAIDLPRSLRNQALDDLAYMGISAASMFPGLDGACQALREKYFRTRPTMPLSRPAGSTAPGRAEVHLVGHAAATAAGELKPNVGD